MPFLTRVDSVEVSSEDFTNQFKQWLANLVDTINEDLALIQGSFIKGTVTLVAGTSTVFTNQINTGDSVFLNLITPLNPGFITVSIVDGVSFTLSSSNGLDASTYSYMIVKF